MKLFILFIVCLTTIINPQQKKIMTELEKQIEEIRLKYIPDKRVEAFNLEIKEDQGITHINGATNIMELKNELESTFSGEKYRTEIEMLPSKELSGKYFGLVNLSVANLRSKPGNTEELATQALLGHPLKVFQKKRGYYLVQTPDKYVSWMDDDGLQLMDEKEVMEWKTANKVIYTGDFGFSYSEANINSIPVSDLVKGNILKKISEEGDFIKAEYPDKREAFIPKKEVADYNQWISGVQLTGENILESSYQLMGIPYLWGGTSVKGMDCSGFTKTVFFDNGLILPRDASQQVFTGDEIDISEGFQNLVPGDLLYFGSRDRDTGKERVTHVAIYLGNNDFIHSSGRVRINSLDKSKDNFSEYRFNSLLRAKRIIKAANQDGLLEAGDLFNIDGMQP
jgi:gamma-D-glutamyl-L-lysine dipeptidyl-peptidase